MAAEDEAALIQQLFTAVAGRADLCRGIEIQARHPHEAGGSAAVPGMLSFTSRAEHFLPHEVSELVFAPPSLRNAPAQTS